MEYTGNVEKDFKKIKETSLENVFNFTKQEENFKENLDKGNIYIPLKLIIDRRLNFNSIELLSLYYSYDKNMEEAEKHISFSKQKLSRIKKNLKELGYLKKLELEPYKLKKLTIKKSHKGFKCEWCGKECHILHQHHFPIPQSKGGTDVVNICPNCHYTFHKLEGANYE